MLPITKASYDFIILMFVKTHNHASGISINLDVSLHVCTYPGNNSFVTILNVLVQIHPTTGCSNSTIRLLDNQVY